MAYTPPRYTPLTGLRSAAPPPGGTPAPPRAPSAQGPVQNAPGPQVPIPGSPPNPGAPGRGTTPPRVTNVGGMRADPLSGASSAGRTSGVPIVQPRAPAATPGVINYDSSGNPIMGGVDRNGNPLPSVLQAPTPQQQLQARSPAAALAATNPSPSAGTRSTGGSTPQGGSNPPPVADPYEQWRMEQTARVEEQRLAREDQTRRELAAREVENQRREQERQWQLEDQQAQQAQLASQTAQTAAEAERERQFAGGQNTQNQAFQGGQNQAGFSHESQLDAERRAAAATAQTQQLAEAQRIQQQQIAEAQRAQLAGQAFQGGQADTERRFAETQQNAANTRQDFTHNTLRAEQIADEQRHIGQLPGLLNTLNGPADPGGGGGTGGAGENAGTLAFARAKDREGVLASRALRDLRGLMTQSGNAGGGTERQALGALVGGTAGNLNDVSLNQANWEANRGVAVEDRNYAGNLQKRQQNLSLAPSILGLFNTSRGAY